MECFQSCLPCCYQFLKDTIWKQFTTNNGSDKQRNSCYQFLKDTIWKQFTTGLTLALMPIWLLSVPQRYNLKAIHNLFASRISISRAVISSSKIQFESNSQLKRWFVFAQSSCYQFLKDTIWKQFTTGGTTDLITKELLSVPQRYNLKAIHNLLLQG